MRDIEDKMSKDLYLRVRVSLEKSDHDGYCSGSESFYTREENVYTFPLPSDFPVKSVGEVGIEDYSDVKSTILHMLPEHGEKYAYAYQSGYCDLSKESESHDLSAHDYRYTILSAHVIPEDSTCDLKDKDYICTVLSSYHEGGDEDDEDEEEGVHDIH